MQGSTKNTDEAKCDWYKPTAETIIKITKK